MKVTIPNWRPISLNVLMRMHWAARNKRVRSDKALIAAYSSGIPKATGKRMVSLHVVLGKGGRQLDADNSFKVLLDGLVFNRLLIDDSPKWVELGNITYSRGKENETTITLEDLP